MSDSKQSIARDEKDSKETKQSQSLTEWPTRPAQLQYEVLAHDAFEPFALALQRAHPNRFRYHRTSWAKFPDGEDNIELGGFTPTNRLRGRNVLFLASFHNNDVTLSQFHALIVLLQSFIESLTVVLPFYPMATMERVTKEGVVATANTTAQLFSSLPSCGKPVRLIVYDLHTLQNRFFWNNQAVADLNTAIPLVKAAMSEFKIDAVAFPDDGAEKRFGSMFAGFPIIVCAKKRDGDRRFITINHGEPRGRHIVIIDDLVRSGGTLFECGKALADHGAASVSAYCTHAVFPQGVWRKFLRGGELQLFRKFFVTNSVPLVAAALPRDDCFHVLDLMPKLVEDL